MNRRCAGATTITEPLPSPRKPALNTLVIWILRRNKSSLDRIVGCTYLLRIEVTTYIGNTPF